MNRLLVGILLLLVIAVSHVFFKPLSFSSQQPQVQNNQSISIEQRTKTSGCQAHNGLQDVLCTPGAINPSLTKDVLCSSGFSTKQVRNVSYQEKQQVYSEYGILSHSSGEYEVDHLISLELGGSNDIANLWPEAAAPHPGFHEKDLVENYLHKQLCNGSITLQGAQQKIASNWLQVYQSVSNIQDYSYTKNQSSSK